MPTTSPFVSALSSMSSTDLLEIAMEKEVMAHCIDLITRLQSDISNIDDENGVDCKRDEDTIDRKDTFELQLHTFNQQNVKFDLQPPSLFPPLMSAHYVCETGSRLLFLSVNWIKSIRILQNLSEDVLVTLLRNCWPQLLILGLVQCRQLLSISSILIAFINQLKSLIVQEKQSVAKLKRYCQHVSKIQDFIMTVNRLNCDEYEFAYLKIITLLSNGKYSICFFFRKAGGREHFFLIFGDF